MRLSQIVLAVFLLCGLALVGCGGGGEVSTISGSELEQYTAENADEIAKQEAIDEAEEAAEEEDEDE